MFRSSIATIAVMGLSGAEALRLQTWFGGRKLNPTVRTAVMGVGMGTMVNQQGITFETQAGLSTSPVQSWHTPKSSLLSQGGAQGSIFRSQFGEHSMGGWHEEMTKPLKEK